MTAAVATPKRETITTFVCPGCDGPLVLSRTEPDEKSTQTVDRYVCPDGCGTFEYIRGSRRFHESPVEHS